MTLFGLIGFASPWLLAALAALPILWLILRAVPPAPIRRRFPGVVLLLGLKDDTQVSDRTPWWLLLLRMLAVAAVIIGLAGPVLNPNEDAAAGTGDGPVLIVMDASWASAADWRTREAAVAQILGQAGRAGRPVGLLRLSAPETPRFQAADALAARLTGITPEAWAPNTDLLPDVQSVLPEGRFDSFWISDGLDRPDRAAILEVLEDRGTVTVFENTRAVVALEPVVAVDGALEATTRRSVAGDALNLTLAGHGTDPAGNPAVLVRVPVAFEGDATETVTQFSVPAELRARITRFEIEGVSSAGAVALPDDALRRREIALIAGREDREGLELLSPLHYLRQALSPTADLLEGALTESLPANPDVVILADVATLSAAEEDALLDWLDQGGLLVRFAGPRLAASDVSRDAEDPLMPVRLRAGGRSVGGAMSWGAPKSVAPFPDDSPFHGLPIPEDVVVNSQVMAQPDPTLADRVIAQLTDGTPLVTRKPVGDGQVILFHVTANAEWSTLPLSGLFVRLLERLAVSASVSQPLPEDLEGTTWQAQLVLDGFGDPRDGGDLAGIDGPTLVSAALGPDLPPGIYQGEDRALARNVVTPETVLAPTAWPPRIAVEGLSQPRERPLGGWLLALAAVLLAADVLASLALSGRLRGPRATAAGLAAALVLVSLATGVARAQDAGDALALEATAEVVLAHVLTGDARVDEIARAGLYGLSQTLYFRTSVEPADPVGVDLERDELAFFPFLYWPVTASQAIPSDAAYAKLNTYLRSGGMILFDTRDADIAGFGANTPEGRMLQQLARPLDIPPLEPVPADHVLTRTFYLLQEFPGRYAGRELWVEAAPPDAQLIDGMPFRNLNDNVTPIVIGGNDWASAWAMDETGNPLEAMGAGFSGERQREIAYRFGVNLVMHVLTGNYKSDQVHVPALLDRLGQ